MENADPTNQIIGLAVKIHRKLGHGLLDALIHAGKHSARLLSRAPEAMRKVVDLV